eukprot:1174269-Rhodomonas_salina.1
MPVHLSGCTAHGTVRTWHRDRAREECETKHTLGSVSHSNAIMSFKLRKFDCGLCLQATEPRHHPPEPLSPLLCPLLGYRRQLSLLMPPPSSLSSSTRE